MEEKDLCENCGVNPTYDGDLCEDCLEEEHLNNCDVCDGDGDGDGE